MNKPASVVLYGCMPKSETRLAVNCTLPPSTVGLLTIQAENISESLDVLHAVYALPKSGYGHSSTMGLWLAWWLITG